MKAEYMAGNTTLSELNFVIFFHKSVEPIFRNQFHFHQRYRLSLPKHVALKQDQLELYSFQYSNESHRKTHYLKPYFKALCHVLWSCILSIECRVHLGEEKTEGFPSSTLESYKNFIETLCENKPFFLFHLRFQEVINLMC